MLHGSIGPTFARIARDADQVGLSSLWVMDHFFQIGVNGPPEHEMLEGYAALAFAAGVTERITLGTLVTGVTYRHPGILVKTVTTLDVLSGGRAWLGIGAAWNEWEHRGLGVPYPSTRERFERLEETLQIAHQMWAGDESPFEGRHYHLERPLNSPAALSTPHPRILVGGHRREEDAAAGRAVRRRVQRLRHGAGQGAGEVRRDPATLRGRRSGLRRHREDRPQPGRLRGRVGRVDRRSGRPAARRSAPSTSSSGWPASGSRTPSTASPRWWPSWADRMGPWLTRTRSSSGPGSPGWSPPPS